MQARPDRHTELGDCRDDCVGGAAARGDEADLKLRENIPDLALIDWMIPGMSGIELIRRLRRPLRRSVQSTAISTRDWPNCEHADPRPPTREH